MKEHNIRMNEYNNSLRNNNIRMMSKDIIEHYQSYDQLKYYSYYLMLDALADENCCNRPRPYRSMFDQYWGNFYCKKAMNTNTDLTDLQFV